MKQLKISKWVMATVVALAMGGDGAWGQEAIPTRTNTAPTIPGAVPVIVAPEKALVFDLDFPGGTVEQFIQYLNDARKIPVNLVFDDRDKKIRIPKLELRNVTGDSIVGVLNAIGGSAADSGEEGFSIIAVDGVLIPGAPRQTTGRVMSKGEEKVFVLVPRNRRNQLEQVKFFNLEAYLVRSSVEDITTALNAGYQLKTGGNERLNLKFHKETQLLMVRGGPEELSMVADVLSQLKPSVPAKAPPAQSKPGEAASKSSGQ